METVNPYQPPTSRAPDAVPDSRLRFLNYLVPATLAVGLTLLLWVVLVSILNGLTGYRFPMLLWAFALFISSSVSIIALSRLWRTTIQPLTFGLSFAIFCIVFAFAEGDTSNGTDYWTMAIVYGALLSLPVAMYFLARRTMHNGRSVM